MRQALAREVTARIRSACLESWNFPNRNASVRNLFSFSPVDFVVVAEIDQFHNFILLIHFEDQDKRLLQMDSSQPFKSYLKGL